LSIELTKDEAEELLGMLKMMYTNHPLTKVISARLAGEPLIEFPKEAPPVEGPPPTRQWKALSSAEIKALWNATKKPSEFALLLVAKLKEKNDVR
jgi:hypothetical protein